MAGDIFTCSCQCHFPAGFSIVIGRRPPPVMRPCATCVAAHKAIEDLVDDGVIPRPERSTGHTREVLIAMLLNRGQAEERQGYGHATAEDVADTVFEWLSGHDA